jgi:hypothetical protein
VQNQTGTIVQEAKPLRVDCVLYVQRSNPRKTTGSQQSIPCNGIIANESLDDAKRQ